MKGTVRTSTLPRERCRCWIYDTLLAILCVGVAVQVGGVNFDNEPCASNSECLGGSCQNGVCQKAFEVILQSPEGGTTPIPTSCIMNFNNNNNITGGTVVQTSDTIALFGQVRTVCKLSSSSPTLIDKFSRLITDVKNDIEVAATGKGLCFYYSEETDEEKDESYNDLDKAENKLCFIVGSTNLSSEWDNSVIVEGSEEYFDGIPKNYALGKPATQSSLYSTGHAQNAVDGNTNGVFNFQDEELNSVTSTASEIEPWWEVDLQGLHSIKEIRIYRRQDGYSGRLLDFTLKISDENNQTTFEESFDDFDDLSTAEFLTFDVRAVSGLTSIYGHNVRITLNGVVPRTLSLAEVQVVGDAVDFDVSFGDLFNIPEREINRMVLIQDGDLSSASVFSKITLAQMPAMDISTAKWIEGIHSSVDGNIQGLTTINRSEDGNYIALRKSDADGVFNKITFYNNAITTEYQDQFTIRAVAISNDGIVVCSAYRESGGTAVRILEITDTGVVLLQTKIGTVGMGTGVSVTPASDKACYSDPVKEKVYIYNLSSAFKFVQDSQLILNAPPYMAGTRFGEKVGLSSNGKALAVAAPEYKSNEGHLVGAVIVYLFDTNRNTWEMMDAIIYGHESRLGLGSGGVTVSDVYGFVDANDSVGIRASYKFDIDCYDKFGIPLVEDNRSFNPNCECGDGRKSSNSIGGKLLRSAKDVCIPCESEEGKGDCTREPLGPTFSPTSLQPTVAPTIISDAPSQIPSVYIQPTLEPTAFPSYPINSLYDGAPCHYDVECIQNVCENFSCKPQDFEIDLKRKPDLPTEKVNALIIPSEDDGGGVLVTPSNKISLYGNAAKVLSFEKMILITANTRLRFSVENVDNAQGVYICFLQYITPFDPDDSRCFQPDLDELQNDIIGFGELRFGLSANLVRYIMFVQTSGISTISNLYLSTEEGGVFCGADCCDKNANKVGNSCICRDGYVSSAGGEKELSDFDEFCLSCLEAPTCGFDGDECSLNGQCWFDVCNNNICESGTFEVFVPDSDNALATLDGDFLNNSNDSGGVIVDGIATVYGDAHKIFMLSKGLVFNKGTDIYFEFERVPNLNSGVIENSADSEVQVCLYESRDGDLAHLAYAYDEHRCAIVTESSMVIRAGEQFFQNREASVNFFAIKQSINGLNTPRTVSIQISNVAISQRQISNQVTSSGRCSDANAETFPVEGICSCKFGYVASNGGNRLNQNDSCVPCLAPIGYDGDDCYMDRSCYSGVCTSNKCFTGSPKILDYNNVQIDAALDASLSSAIGGVMVDPFDKLELFGTTTKIYKLSTFISFNRFIEMTFSFSLAPDATNLKLCLYNSPELVDCQSSCYNIESSDTSPITIDAASLLSYRSTDLKYIGFSQETAGGNEVTSSISDLKLIEGPTSNAYENGKCNDPNARDIHGPVKVIDGEEIKCVCTDGYISTNGGKLLRNQDACISCISQQCVSLDSNDVCASQLLVNALLGGLGGEPTPLYGTILEESFPPSFGNGQGGGAEVRNEIAVSFYGECSKTYKLGTPYEIGSFSRMSFSLYAENFNGFLAICLIGEINPNNTNSTLCFNVGKNDEEKWDRSKYTTYDFNLALGKSASHMEGNPDYAAINAVDGNTLSEMTGDEDQDYPVTMTAQLDFPWWEVNLGGSYCIDSIVIHFTKNRRIDVLSDYKVEVYDSAGRLTYHYAGPEVLDRTSSPFEANVFLPTDVNIYGSRVKITMVGERRILSLREVQVFERSYFGSPKRLVDLPIGKYRPGIEVNYISFIQSATNQKEITNIEDLRFIYGFAETVTEEGI